MHTTTGPNVRVVVRLPYNRPEQSLEDLPRVEWNSEKADILWKVIERSRTTDNGGTDWKGLADHLNVPLPYLLYRVHARFQEDLRGLQKLPGVLNPSSTPSVNGAQSSDTVIQPTHPTRLNTALGIRARLASISMKSTRRRNFASSNSTLTVQAQDKSDVTTARNEPTYDGSDSDESEAIQEEEERAAEEQELLERKLQDLQRLMTNERLGLVSSGLKSERGRDHTTLLDHSRRFSRSTSQSLSSTSSPQGSIPEIPSPLQDSQPQSPTGRHSSPTKSVSPPAMSPRHAIGQSHLRRLAGRNHSEQSSTQGSETSSFSDISDASLSGSALESALLSNIRGNPGGSRFSAFGKSRFSSRGPH